MKFSGLQKISLIDYPDKIASVAIHPGLICVVHSVTTGKSPPDPQPPFLQEGAALELLEGRKRLR